MKLVIAFALGYWLGTVGRHPTGREYRAQKARDRLRYGPPMAGKRGSLRSRADVYVPPEA